MRRCICKEQCGDEGEMSTEAYQYGKAIGWMCAYETGPLVCTVCRGEEGCVMKGYTRWQGILHRFVSIVGVVNNDNFLTVSAAFEWVVSVNRFCVRSLRLSSSEALVKHFFFLCTYFESVKRREICDVQNELLWRSTAFEFCASCMVESLHLLHVYSCSHRALAINIISLMFLCLFQIYHCETLL